MSDAIRQYGTYQINEGDKLAQLVIVPIWTPELKQVEEFESVSERGAKGFGSSGCKDILDRVKEVLGK